MKNAIPLLALALLLSACQDHRSERQEDTNTQQVEYKLPQNGDIEYGKHGEEKWFAYGALNGAANVPANGVAQAHMFADGRFLHTLQLNIDPPRDGYYYEGWLVKGNSYVSTGHLVNPFGDSRHTLRYEADKDYSTYLKVVVTLEPDDGNPAPAQHVAEGLMKVTQR